MSAGPTEQVLSTAAGREGAMCLGGPTCQADFFNPESRISTRIWSWEQKHEVQRTLAPLSVLDWRDTAVDSALLTGLEVCTEATCPSLPEGRVAAVDCFLPRRQGRSTQLCFAKIATLPPAPLPRDPITPPSGGPVKSSPFELGLALVTHL